jgi:hypothetical protein
MPFELLAVIFFFTCIFGFLFFIFAISPGTDFKWYQRLVAASLSVVIPLSIFLWIKLAPYPDPTNITIPIQSTPIGDTYVAVIDGDNYINVNKVTGCQVDPNKHLLKITYVKGWIYGIYCNFGPTYSLVNKNLEKGN